MTTEPLNDAEPEWFAAIPEDDWPFPAETLYRWLVMGKRADQLHEAAPYYFTAEWQRGWDACLDTIRDGIVPIVDHDSPNQAIRALRDMAAMFAGHHGMNVHDIAANLQLVAQLLADEIERQNLAKQPDRDHENESHE